MVVSGAMRNSSGAKISERTLEQVFHDILRGESGGTSPEGAEKIGAVSAAHRIFTNSLAALPWMIRRREGQNRREIDHDIADVLKRRANEYMTPFMAEKILYSRAFWHGVGYAWIERDEETGRVKSLIPIPVEPEISVNRKDGTRWYKFELPEENVFGERISKTFGESQLFRYTFESYDGMTGRGFLDMAGEMLDTDLKAQNYNNKFYTNGARPSGIIEVAAELGKTKRDMLKEEFSAKYSGDNAFKVAVLDLGMKYTQLGISHQESQYVENRNFSVEEVSRFTGIPVYMLQAGKQSYQSNEQQQLDFVMNVMTPHLVQIEQEAMFKLFSEQDRADGCYLKKNEAAMLRGTHATRAEYYQKMMGMGVYNQDEIRAMEDLSPLPDGMGQSFWMSKNYAPIDDKSAFGGTNTVEGGEE